MYLKGVTDFERDQGLMETVMPNSSKRDIGNQRRAFEDFALLLQRYPNSKYGGDARRRMLYSPFEGASVAPDRTDHSGGTGHDR